MIKLHLNLLQSLKHIIFKCIFSSICIDLIMNFNFSLIFNKIYAHGSLLHIIRTLLFENNKKLNINVFY